MTRAFRVGDRVEWNSEAGRVRGRIIKKVTAPMVFKGYRRHASKAEPQYLIKSERTEHVAIHKGTALTKLRAASARRPKESALRRRKRRPGPTMR